MRFLPVLLLFIFCVPGPLFAQTQPPSSGLENIQPAARYNVSAGVQYRQAVTQALGMSPKFSFADLRLLYTMTPHYDPVGEVTQRSILKFAEQVKKTNAGSDENKKALIGYRALVDAHLANIDVISMALAMAEEDNRLGDPEFLKWVYRGLLGSVLESGDGTSVNKAYDALTLGEETVLLRNLKVKTISSEATHAGAVYYNTHLVQDRQSGAQYLVYVDITKPMEYLTWEKERRKATVSLPAR